MKWEVSQRLERFFPANICQPGREGLWVWWSHKVPDLTKENLIRDPKGSHSQSKSEPEEANPAPPGDCKELSHGATKTLQEEKIIPPRSCLLKLSLMQNCIPNSHHLSGSTNIPWTFNLKWPWAYGAPSTWQKQCKCTLKEYGIIPSLQDFNNLRF